jgi:Fic family protein
LKYVIIIIQKQQGAKMELKIWGYTIKINKNSEKEGENRVKTSPISEKKIQSAKRAAEIKAKRAEKKVLEAIMELRERGEKITAYKIAKLKGISYNTAKKYL